MTEPYVSEIRLMSFAEPPRGWAPCDGRLLAVADHPALHAVLGTRYGGDGVTTFGVPDLRGRTALHATPDYPLGRTGGEATHPLTPDEMPAHTHGLMASPAAATSNAPGPTLVPAQSAVDFYRSPTSLTPMAAGMVAPAGNSRPHENLQPYLVLNFCIALEGAPLSAL